MTPPPDQYGVIGHPVAHSLSPFIHGLFARQTGQELVYRLHDVAPPQFRSHVLEFFARGGRGLERDSSAQARSRRARQRTDARVPSARAPSTR